MYTMTNIGIIVCAVIALVILTVISLMAMYKKCPPDEILIKYGKVGNGNKSAKIIHGNGAFVIPIIQAYTTMSLRPIQFNLDIKEAAAKGMIRTNVPTNVAVVVSKDPALQQVAVERLLGMNGNELQDLLKEIVYGQMRIVIANMTVEELNNNRETFIKEVMNNVDTELKKYGLELKTLNIQDIRDTAKIIENLGEQAKAEADKIAQVNIATQRREKSIKVAEQSKLEETTVANTNKEKAISVAEATRDKEAGIARAEAEKFAQIQEASAELDIRKAEAAKKSQLGQNEAEKDVAKSNAELEVVTAEADKTAKIGRNKAEADVAKSNAELEVTKAEANQKEGEARVKAEAVVNKTKEEQEKLVQIAKADKVKAALTAEKIIPAQMAKEEIEIAADAEAEKSKRVAQGEADAILAKAKAEAEAVRLKGEAEGKAREAILKAEADNFAQMLAASEAHPEIAVQFKMVDNYVKIAEHQADAYSNLRLGDVKVYGDATTAGNFMESLMKSIAPTFDMLRSMPLPGKMQKALSENTTNDMPATDVKFDDPA